MMFDMDIEISYLREKCKLQAQQLENDRIIIERQSKTIDEITKAYDNLVVEVMRRDLEGLKNE